MTNRYEITLSQNELFTITMALGSLAEEWWDLTDDETDQEERNDLRDNAINAGHIFDKIAELRDIPRVSEVRCYPVIKESKK